MSAAIVEIGAKFGRWTIVGAVPRKIGRGSMTQCECTCDCGAKAVVRFAHMKAGKSVSCGCLRRELNADRMRKKATHSMSQSPEYMIWRSMKERCNNPNHQSYDGYGGRGIAVCDAWSDSFEAFYADMAPRPPGTSIDRIDNDSGYSPDNCRWATIKQQARNKRSNSILAFRGRSITVAEFSEITGIPHSTASADKRKGLVGDEIFKARRLA